MEALKEFISNGLTQLTLVASIFIVVCLLIIFIKPLQKIKIISETILYFKSKAILWSGIIALVATTGSLFFSDIMGYNPCRLCWYQRIFMYPIVILSIVGLSKKSKEVMSYIVTLSFFGWVIALYHYLMQRGLVEASNCTIVGYSSSCSSTFMLDYGFITIPFMALVAFTLIIGLWLIQLEDKRWFK